MPATADAMEKNTRGTIAVKRRFKNKSPKGFRKTTSFFSTTPATEPIPIEAIRSSENP
jgi:hypothetical protein